jgi:hypothetical protein
MRRNLFHGVSYLNDGRAAAAMGVARERGCKPALLQVLRQPLFRLELIAGTDFTDDIQVRKAIFVFDAEHAIGVAKVDTHKAQDMTRPKGPSPATGPSRPSARCRLPVKRRPKCPRRCCEDSMCAFRPHS